MSTRTNSYECLMTDNASPLSVDQFRRKGYQKKRKILPTNFYLSFFQKCFAKHKLDRDVRELQGTNLLIPEFKIIATKKLYFFNTVHQGEKGGSVVLVLLVPFLSVFVRQKQFDDDEVHFSFNSIRGSKFTPITANQARFQKLTSPFWARTPPYFDQFLAKLAKIMPNGTDQSWTIFLSHSVQYDPISAHFFPWRYCRNLTMEYESIQLK